MDRSRWNLSSLLLAPCFIRSETSFILTSCLSCLLYIMMSLLSSRRHIYCFPGCQRVPERSLLGLCLVSIAQSTGNQLLTCRFGTTDLPVHLRQYLLGYIAVYRSRGVAIGELQTLLRKPDTDSTNGQSPYPAKMRHLDLSGPIGSSLTFDELNGFRAGAISIDFTSLTHLCHSVMCNTSFFGVLARPK